MVSNIHTALTACIFWDIYCSTITQKMQGLIVVKTHLLKFLSISDKSGLDQLKTIITTRSTILPKFIHAYPRPIRKWKYLVLRKSAQSHRPNQAHLLLSSYFMEFLVFRRFLCLSYQNSLHGGTSKVKYCQQLTKYKLCSFNSFCLKFKFYFILCPGCGT